VPSTGWRRLITAGPIAARETHEVVNAHTARKERHSEEETDDEYGDHHEHPGKGLEAAEAERLENARAYNTDDRPHHNGVEILGEEIVNRASGGDQKNGGGRLTEPEVHHLFGVAIFTRR
jgi:hypothetical protein